MAMERALGQDRADALIGSVPISDPLDLNNS
jgi:hypothetical protein